MGCDIHIFAEKRRADGSYEPVDIEVDDQIGDYKFTRDLLDNRNYGLFAWLAGVRNYSGVEPLSTPRGLPADASKAVADEHAQWGCDAHSASWFTVAELLAVDFTQVIEDRRVTRQIAPNHWDGGCTADVGEGQRTTLRDFLGANVEQELRLMAERGADRIVFWFDN